MPSSSPCAWPARSSSGAGGGGRRREVEFDLDAVFGNTERQLQRLEAQERRAQGLLERSGKGAAKRFEELHKELERGRQSMKEFAEWLEEFRLHSTPDPFDLQSYAAVSARAQEIDAARAEAELEQRLRAIEEQRALGVDPLMLLEQETQARLALIETQELAANDTLAIMELQNAREQQLHELKLARLAEEAERRTALTDTVVGLVEKSALAHYNAAVTVAQAVLLEDKSLKESVKNVAASEALQHTILGGSELIKAAIAAASYNYPKAALHVANAAQSFIFAGAMAAAYGVAAAGGGGRRKAATPGLAEGVGAAPAVGTGPTGQAGATGTSVDDNPLPDNNRRPGENPATNDNPQSGGNNRPAVGPVAASAGGRAPPARARGLHQRPGERLRRPAQAILQGDGQGAP